MKHIFVTIEEFLQNGGILEADREIFSANQSKTEFSLYGYFKSNPEAGVVLIHNATYKMAPVSSYMFYVKIEVTPIWK